jgi:hypothetical protein
MNRSRLFFYAETLLAQGQSINLSRVLPFHAEILQFSFHASQVIWTELPVDLFVESVEGPQFDYTLITWFPITKLPTNDLVCSDHGWQLRQGDTLRVTYGNPSDVTVGIQIIVKEGD